MNKSKFYYVVFFIFCFVLHASAAVQLPAVIGDNMVLQQQSEAPIWGWADPGEMVTVEPGWSNKVYQTKTAPDGLWMVLVETPSAGGPYTVDINDVQLKNVMIGEVWVCSGQSNMQWAVRQAMNPDEEITAADFPNLRLFYVAREFSDAPKEDCYGTWRECSPSTAATFSAVAYFFGRELHQKLNIPIGLIHTSWGGTPAEAWTRKGFLEKYPELQVYFDRFYKRVEQAEPGILPLDQRSPSSLYNAMIAPLIPYAIKGAIWYQGEANVRDAKLYETLFPAMITNWRSDWGQGDFPFYFVQLAPYNYDLPVVGAALREAQRKTLSFPNTGMAVTLDIGNPFDIHPKNKQDVGKRLALWALANDYGMDNLTYSGPLYKSMKVEGNKVRLYFDHVENGFKKPDGPLTHFTISGKDKVFHPAEAKIDGKTIVVSSKHVKKPVAVRFAFGNTDEPNLFNNAGLPASSFRTDDWPIFTERVQIEGTFDRKSGKYRVEMRRSNPSLEIRFTTDDSEPTIKSKLYKEPFSLDKTTRLKARVFKEDTPSLAITEHLFLMHAAIGKKITLEDRYSPRYQAGGKFALVDGIRGSYQFNDGIWQGYEQADLEAVIDLEKAVDIRSVSTRFFQSVGSWIFFPKRVIFSISTDGKSFEQVAEMVNTVPEDTPGLLVKEFSEDWQPKRARYVKVEAENVGICPDWHPGAGGKAWLFVDEIVVE